MMVIHTTQTYTVYMRYEVIYNEIRTASYTAIIYWATKCNNHVSLTHISTKGNYK